MEEKAAPPAASRITMLGPPGAGKGTQAGRLARHLGVPHISTGAALRDEVQKRTPLGLRVEKLMAAGRLVPDELMVDLIRDQIQRPNAAAGFVLDGFPRTLRQAEELDRLLLDLQRPLQAAVLLIVPEDELLRRVAGRAAAAGRADDSLEVVRSRLRIYEAETLPVADYYARQGILARVDGVGTIVAVSRRIQEAVVEVQGRRAG